MQIKIYQVDAFADKVFTGNPAAVCPLDAWLPDDTLQKIAMENNLAETAFYVNEKEGLRIRWFTPSVEVDLCGHATLATASVLFDQEGYKGNIVTFNSRSGPLTVIKDNDFLTLDFPADHAQEIEFLADIIESFNIKPIKILEGRIYYLLIFENEMQVRTLKPDLRKLMALQKKGVIVSAKGDSVDFVSRFFAPKLGVDEDPVTGSAHSTLIPYWSRTLNKSEMNAIQCSARGGSLKCKMKTDRVDMSGQVKHYLTGTIFIP